MNKKKNEGKKIDIEKMSKETGIEKNIIMFYLGTLEETKAKSVKEAKHNFCCAPKGSPRKLPTLKRWITLSLEELKTIDSLEDLREKTKLYPDHEKVNEAIFKKWLKLSGEKNLKEMKNYFFSIKDNDLAKEMIIKKLSQFY